MKRFLLADDHHIVRTGLRMLIKEEFLDAAIDECGNGDCLLQKLRQELYDIIILDITMPRTDSLHLLKHIFVRRPDQKVMIFTMCSAGIYAKKYLSLGVKGFVNKEAQPEEVRKVIAAIVYNHRYQGNAGQYILTHDDMKKQGPTPFDSLSVRELEIMSHLIGGKNVSEIADILSLHISTVSTHKASIMQKLGVSNVIELNKIAQMF